MEGCEAKHIAISQYAKKSTYGNRWQLISPRKYISLILLRERGYNLSNYTVSKKSYFPKGLALIGFVSVAFGWKLGLVLVATVLALTESGLN